MPDAPALSVPNSRCASAPGVADVGAESSLFAPAQACAYRGNLCAFQAHFSLIVETNTPEMTMDLPR